MQVRWRELGSVLTDKATPFWLLVGGVLASCPLSYGFTVIAASPYLGTQVRYAGILLEVFGFVLVALGIRDTRKLFERPSLVASVKQWSELLLHCFSTRKHPAMAAVTGRFNLNLPPLQWKGTGTVRRANLHERVEILERQIVNLRDVITKQAQELRDGVGELAVRLKEEESQRLTAVGATSEKLEQLAVGGLGNEIVGLVWVVLGTVLSNAPEEAARIFSKIIY